MQMYKQKTWKLYFYFILIAKWADRHFYAEWGENRIIRGTTLAIRHVTFNARQFFKLFACGLPFGLVFIPHSRKHINSSACLVEIYQRSIVTAYTSTTSKQHSFPESKVSKNICFFKLSWSNLSLSNTPITHNAYLGR